MRRPKRRLCGEAAVYGTKCLLLEDAEDFFFTHDQQLFAVQLDLCARVPAKQNAIASLHVEREYLTLVVRFALADRDHLALLRLLFCRIRDDDATTDALALFNAPNQNPVVQRCKRCCRHCFSSPCFDFVANGVSVRVVLRDQPRQPRRNLPQRSWRNSPTAATCGSLIVQSSHPQLISTQASRLLTI